MLAFTARLLTGIVNLMYPVGFLARGWLLKERMLAVEAADDFSAIVICDVVIVLLHILTVVIDQVLVTTYRSIILLILHFRVYKLLQYPLIHQMWCRTIHKRILMKQRPLSTSALNKGLMALVDSTS